MIRRQRIALALHRTRSIRYRALPLGVALHGLLRAIYEPAFDRLLTGDDLARPLLLDHFVRVDRTSHRVQS